MLFSSFAITASSFEKSNIIILADDMGYSGSEIVAPHINRPAKKACRASSSSIILAAAHLADTSLLTGLQTEVTGVLNINTDFRKALPYLVTLAQLFKNNGYTTSGNGQPKPEGAPFAPNPTGDPTTLRVGPSSDQMIHPDHRAILSIRSSSKTTAHSTAAAK